jgi:hypothetical protein
MFGNPQHFFYPTAEPGPAVVHRLGQFAFRGLGAIHRHPQLSDQILDSLVYLTPLVTPHRGVEHHCLQVVSEPPARYSGC